VEFLRNLGEAGYLLWPEWAPKDCHAMREIATLIDNASFFAKI